MSWQTVISAASHRCGIGVDILDTVIGPGLQELLLKRCKALLHRAFTCSHDNTHLLEVLEKHRGRPVRDLQLTDSAVDWMLIEGIKS